MTELERKALLGDQEAQKECTEKRIAIPCPCCGCEERDMIGLSVSHDQYYYSCESCGCNGPIVYDNANCDYPEYEALAAWNRRPAPPIGRCGKCKHISYDEEYGNRWCNLNIGSRIVRENDYCRYFEPKESE